MKLNRVSFSVMLSAGFALLCSELAYAGAGRPCEKVDRAQLKDLSRSELIQAYCAAKSQADSNKSLRAKSTDLFNQQSATGLETRDVQKEAAEQRDAQESCARAAQSFGVTLANKFNAQRPRCD